MTEYGGVFHHLFSFCFTPCSLTLPFIPVASSDATNIKASILPHPKDPSKVIINAHKWWISGAGDPRCKVHLLMGKSDPSNPDRHKQQTMVIIPADAPGVKVVRPLTVMGCA